MSNFGWSYPPGVTGNEYEISGPDYEQYIDGVCPGCGADELFEEWCRGERWNRCCVCGFVEDLPALGTL